MEPKDADKKLKLIIDGLMGKQNHEKLLLLTGTMLMVNLSVN